MNTMSALKKFVCFSVFVPILMFSGCGDLAFVRPIDQQRDTTLASLGTTTADVPIEIDFTASTSARNIVLDGNINITTAPVAGFITTPGGGQKGWDRMSGKYPMAGGNHSLTASADYLDMFKTTQTVTKTVQFTVVGPLPDLQAIVTSNVQTFQGGTPVDFEVRIYNLGPSPANNIPFVFFTNFPAGMSALSIDSGFVCHGISNVGQRLQVSCSGGNIAGNNQATMKVTVKPNPPVPSGVSFTLFGDLDSPPSIPESFENNNSFTKGVLVVP